MAEALQKRSKYDLFSTKTCKMIPCGSNNLACGSIIVANQLNLGMGMILPATDGKTITQFYRLKGRGGSGQAPPTHKFLNGKSYPNKLYIIGKGI